MDVLLGNVTGGHGVKGWVKVASFTEPREALLGYSPWRLCGGEGAGGYVKEARVLGGRTQGRQLLAQLEGVADRDQAEALRGWQIRLPKERLPELPEGEFYWFQLEGLPVRNLQGELLGKVARLLPTGANDVLVVQPMPGSLDDAERLIPYVDGQVVKSVQLGTGAGGGLDDAEGRIPYAGGQAAHSVAVGNDIGGSQDDAERLVPGAGGQAAQSVALGAGAGGILVDWARDY